METEKVSKAVQLQSGCPMPENGIEHQQQQQLKRKRLNAVLNKISNHISSRSSMKVLPRVKEFGGNSDALVKGCVSPVKSQKKVHLNSGIVTNGDKSIRGDFSSKMFNRSEHSEHDKEASMGQRCWLKLPSHQAHRIVAGPLKEVRYIE